MNYRLALLGILIFSAVAMSGCSSSNSSAPPDSMAHPTGWLATHSSAISSNADYADCTSCHGRDLAGSGDAVSCYSCHSFNSSIPFSIHPATWTETFVDHRAYAQAHSAASCTPCHGAELLGSAVAPSCFAGSVDGLSCHPEGPGVAPHAQDGSYLQYGNHGPDAKADLEVCQNCHGELTPTGSSPRFNLGIYSITSSGCEGCHNDYTAHPSVGDRDNAHWYGATVTHADSGNLEACALCHGDTYDGNADTGAPACLDCHGADPVANNEGCVSCHGMPPDGEGLVGAVMPNRAGQHDSEGHSIFIDTEAALTCDRCHNGSGYGTDQHYDLEDNADIQIFHPDASDTITATGSGANLTCTGACHITYKSFDFTYDHDAEPWYED